MTIEHKETHPEVPRLIESAGNLAVLCLRGGRPDMARTLVHFTEVMRRSPMTTEDGALVEGVRHELAYVRTSFRVWARVAVGPRN